MWAQAMQGALQGFYMRRAMICVSVMLALFQIWPTIFGQRGAGALAAETALPSAPKPSSVAAAVKAIPIPARASNLGSAAPRSCEAQYQAALRRCDATDKSCRIKTIDQSDVCDATGFWPE